MVVHALGSDMEIDNYLRGDDPSILSTAGKYMPYITIAGALLIAVLVMVGTGGKRM